MAIKESCNPIIHELLTNGMKAEASDAIYGTYYLQGIADRHEGDTGVDALTEDKAVRDLINLIPDLVASLTDLLLCIDTQHESELNDSWEIAKGVETYAAIFGIEKGDVFAHVCKSPYLTEH